MSITKNEAAFICAFLADLSDQQGNAGCNDLTIKDTPENQQMVAAAEKASYGGDTQLSIGKGKIHTCDHIVVDHLQQRLMTEFGLNRKDLPNVTG